MRTILDRGRLPINTNLGMAAVSARRYEKRSTVLKRFDLTWFPLASALRRLRANARYGQAAAEFQGFLLSGDETRCSPLCPLYASGETDKANMVLTNEIRCEYSTFHVPRREVDFVLVDIERVFELSRVS